MKTSFIVILSVVISACQQVPPAPVVVSPAPQVPVPPTVATPSESIKKAAPKPKPRPKKKVEPKEEEIVPVLPLRPNQVGSRVSILP